MGRILLILVATLFLVTIVVSSSSSSSADKIANSDDIYQFYTDLSGRDIWFESTSEDEMIESWADDEGFNLYRSLSRMGPFAYQHDIHIHLIGLSHQDPGRIVISDSEVRALLESASYQSSRHYPLSYSTQVVQTLKYTIHRSDNDLQEKISKHLQTELQRQYDSAFPKSSGSGLDANRNNPQAKVEDIIFRISPQPIESIISDYLTALEKDKTTTAGKRRNVDGRSTLSPPQLLKRPSIFILAPISPQVRDRHGNMISVSYIYTHLPTTVSATAQQSAGQQFLTYKPNPRCDFKQYTSARSPIVFIDLVSEQLHFHGLAMKDIPVIQIKPPSIFYAQQQAHHRFALPLTTPAGGAQLRQDNGQLSQHAKEHIKNQFIQQVAGVIQHTVEHVFLAHQISTAPLLAPKTLLKIYYIAENPSTSQVTRSLQNIVNQVQHLSPDGYIIDAQHTPISILQCPLCVNGINNSLRRDGMNRFLDSSLLFDLFEHFDLPVWSKQSSSKTITFAHQHNYDHITSMSTYSRTINVFIIDPPEQYESIILFDKLYQTVANNDKTMILSILTPLAPTLDCPNTEMAPMSMNMLMQSPSNNDQSKSLHSNRYHIPITHQSILSTFISVVFGYGSSRSIAFPGGPPIVDSLYVLDGTHPPYNRPLVAGSVKYNINMLLINQLAADVINTCNGVRTLLMRYNIDINQLDEITISNIIVRSNMLEYKIERARSIINRQEYEKSIAYLLSARHDLKWFIELLTNMIHNFEPITICADDIAKKTKITGLFDLISTYLGEDDDELYGGGARFTNHNSTAYKQHVRRVEDYKRGASGVDHDVKQYISHQSQTGIILFVAELFMVIFLVSTCGLCLILGRKRRQQVLDYGNQLLSGDFTNPFTYDSSSSRYDRHRRQISQSTTGGTSTGSGNFLTNLWNRFVKRTPSHANYTPLPTSSPDHYMSTSTTDGNGSTMSSGNQSTSSGTNSYYDF